MKKEIAHNLDQFTRQPPDLSIVGSAGGWHDWDAENRFCYPLLKSASFALICVISYTLRPTTFSPLSYLLINEHSSYSKDF